MLEQLSLIIQQAKAIDVTLAVVIAVSLGFIAIIIALLGKGA